MSGAKTKNPPTIKAIKLKDMLAAFPHNSTASRLSSLSSNFTKAGNNTAVKDVATKVTGSSFDAFAKIAYCSVEKKRPITNLSSCIVIVPTTEANPIGIEKTKIFRISFHSNPNAIPPAKFLTHKTPTTANPHNDAM